MHVKMLIGKLAGSAQEVPHHVGESLVMMGQAEQVEDPNAEHATEEAVETSTAAPTERATARPARAGKAKDKK